MSLLALLSFNLTQQNLRAAEESACDPQYLYHAKFGSGEYSAVAAHSSGLALHFYNAGYGAVYYQVGALAGERTYWAAPQLSHGPAWRPAVTISKEGFVIAVFSDKQDGVGCKQYYRVGWINPHGRVDQSINWLTQVIYLDEGSKSSVAMNDSGFIVAAYEKYQNGRAGLNYRVGRLANPSSGNYTIQWLSGQGAIGYDEGINPHIAINNLNQVVEVHEVPGGHQLQSRRGIIAGNNGSEIKFEQPQRYDDNAADPAIILTDNGMVLEVHISDGLFSRVGTLIHSNQHEIQWQRSTKVRENFDAVNPAFAADGVFAIVVYRDNEDPGNSLYLSTARTCYYP